MMLQLRNDQTSLQQLVIAFEFEQNPSASLA